VSKASDRELAQKLVDQELGRWEQNLRPLWDEWDGYWEKWAITTPDAADNPYQSKEQVPYPHSAVETLIPRILGEEPSMTYQATEDPEDELAAELCGAAATWQMQLMAFDQQARDWVRQGLGIGWRSTWEIQAELKRGELVTVLDDFAVGNYSIQAVFPQQRYLPAKIRHFIDHLKAVYNTPGYWERQLDAG